MDEQTALVLAIQLIALFSIAGALLLYLLCKIRAGVGYDCNENSPGAGKPVLVTSCDSALGLQIAIHLANHGFRVFAGLKEGIGTGSSSDSISSRVIRAWQKHRESQPGIQGTLFALPLDVTREDLLHEAVDLIRAHLPAGEDGIWAVVCTNGLCYRGRLDQQDVSQWDAMLKTNVVGVLRTARALQALLRNTGGRLIMFGSTQNEEAGLVAYTAARYAAEGASKALRQELGPCGIKVVTLNPNGLQADLLFLSPVFTPKQDTSEIPVEPSNGLEYYPKILSANALQIFDVAVTTSKPKENYDLAKRLIWTTSFKSL